MFSNIVSNCNFNVFCIKIIIFNHKFKLTHHEKKHVMYCSAIVIAYGF